MDKINVSIAISGFGGKSIFKDTAVNIKETVENVDYLIIKEDLDYIQFKSSKIKQAMMKNVPIITYSDFLKKISN